MEIWITPYNEELTSCLATIENLKSQLEEAYDKKNTLLQTVANFYTNQLQNGYFEKKDSGQIGQIGYVFCDKGEFFVHLQLVDITERSKLTRKEYNVELFGEEMKHISLLNESDFKEKFFEYVTNRIKIINMG